ncbi:MAG: hypothetical protein ACOCVF_03790 [bacterium]
MSKVIELQFDRQSTVDTYLVSFPNNPNDDTRYYLEVHTLIDDSKEYIVLDEDDNIIDCETIENAVVSQYHMMMSGSTLN